MEHPWGLKDVEEKSLRRSKPRKRKEAESKAPPKPPGVVYSGSFFRLQIYIIGGCVSG